MTHQRRLPPNRGSLAATSDKPFVYFDPNSFLKNSGFSHPASLLKPVTAEIHKELTTCPRRRRVKLRVDPFSAFAAGQPNRVLRVLKMTSTRVPPRRIQTQLPIPTPARPTISVEEWEAKAPLLDSATKSINAIKAASENRPLPPKVCPRLVTHRQMVYQPSVKFLPDDVLTSRPSTPIRKLGGSSSRPGTPNTPTTARGSVTLHALHPKQPIQTPQQFYDWFTLIDQSVARSQESHFHAHLETVTSNVEMCDSVLERIELLEGEVTDMLEGWRGVEEGGKSLKDACERLLVEKVSLSFISLQNPDLISWLCLRTVLWR